MTLTAAEIDVLARYLHNKSYDLRDLALIVTIAKDVVPVMLRQAQQWDKHEQELQARFNEDAARVAAS